jgi:hypothetical protein
MEPQLQNFGDLPLVATLDPVSPLQTSMAGILTIAARICG